MPFQSSLQFRFGWYQLVSIHGKLASVTKTESNERWKGGNTDENSPKSSDGTLSDLVSRQTLS